MFKLDRQGKCYTCLNKAKDTDVITCEICEFHFHAVCDSDDGKGPNKIAVVSHLKLFKQSSTKKNFSWKCDQCLTISEQNQAATVKEAISQFMVQFADFKNTLPDKIKQIVKSEMENVTTSQTEEFNKFTENINTQPTAPSYADKVRDTPPDTKKAILVKADKDGRPVDKKKVSKIIRDNGVQVNKVVVSSTGDTFINLPDDKSRDKLQPLLQSEDNNVVMLKSKLPSISIMGVTEDLSKEEIKQGICNQNESIGILVNDQKEEFEVIYLRAPPPHGYYHQVTIRVSPKIRRLISNLGNKIFLSGKHCQVQDSFHIRRCNKCQEFGHYAGKCPDEKPEVCGYCGANHKSNTCMLKNSHSSTHKCVNCEIAGLEIVEGHSTFYKHCPAYKIQQEKLQNAIGYDYSLN